MRPLPLCAAVLAAALARPAPATHDAPTDRRAARAALDHALLQLESAAARLREPDAPPEQALAHLAQARASLAAVQAFLERRPPLAVCLEPMSAGELEGLMRFLDARTTLSDRRAALLEEVARDACFSVEQVLAVLQTIAFSRDRVEAAAALYPHVVDHQNWYRVHEVLPYPGDRKRLAELIAGD